MLEKLNSIVSDHHAGRIIKQIVGPKEAQSELASLKTLNSFAGFPSQTRRFCVPEVYEAESSTYSVSMARVSGVRIYELIAILNTLMSQSPRTQIAEKAFSLKTSLVEWALNDLAFFQTARVQSALKTSLTSILSVYGFREKFLEALTYLSELTGAETNSRLYEEVEHICSVLSAKADVTFRDATLKNRLLSIPELDNVRDDANALTAMFDYYRPTNIQWTNLTPILPLLDRLTSIDDIRSRIYNLDFESAHTLTTRQDDYIHVLTLEITGWNYDRAYRFCETEIKIAEEEYNVALLFRCFREWVRRLFYKCERNRIYQTRYHHETLGHNFDLAFDALQRLRKNSHKDYLPELHLFLSNFKMNSSLSNFV